MEDCKLVKKSYWMLWELDQAKRTNWATAVKSLLYKFGFGEIWISQEIGDPEVFLFEFRQRISDCSTQDWHANINSIDKLNTYCTFKSLLSIEQYLLEVTNVKHRQALSKLRISAHRLKVEEGRHQGIEREEQYCMYCLTNGQMRVEDEFHFMIICGLYKELRMTLIQDLIITSSYESFVRIMQEGNTDALKQISRYVFECYVLRELFLSQL